MDKDSRMGLNVGGVEILHVAISFAAAIVL
jgi:hypothetical protein